MMMMQPIILEVVVVVVRTDIDVVVVVVLPLLFNISSSSSGTDTCHPRHLSLYLSMVRLAVLRLASIGMLYAKEDDSPVVLALIMLEPLSDLQLRCIANASPWAPVMIEASVDDIWHHRSGGGGTSSGFGARVHSVEPRIIPTTTTTTIRPKNRLKDGLLLFKRKRVTTMSSCD
jgi:hypothetical protein